MITEILPQNLNTILHLDEYCYLLHETITTLKLAVTTP